MRNTRRSRKLLAFALAFCLVFTMAVPSFAAGGVAAQSKPLPTHTYNKNANGSPLNYVAIGDSQANGYYLEGYFKRNNNGDLATDEEGLLTSTGFNTYIEGLYSELFAKHLADTTKRTVNYYQYAMSALRCEDLHKLLDPSASIDDFYRQWFNDDYEGGWKYLLYSYWNHDEATDAFAPYGNYEKASNDYIQAVSDADIISLALGINSIGNFCCNRLLAVLSGDTEGEYARMQIDKTAYLGMNKIEKKLFDSIYDKAMTAVKSMIGESNAQTLTTVEQLVWDLVYAVTGFATGYKECLSDIRRLNPDVTLINVGLSNVADGLVLTFKEKGIDIPVNIGTIFGLVLEAGNLYIETEAEKSGLNTMFVRPGSFEKIITQIAALDKNAPDFKSIVEHLSDLSVCYLLENYGEEVFGPVIYEKMFSPDSEDPEAVVFNEEYVRSCIAKALAEGDGAQSAEVPDGNVGVTDEEIGNIYLGVRDAVIDASKGDGKIAILSAFPVFTKAESAVEMLQNCYKDQPLGTPLREKAYNTFMQPGVSDFLYICTRMLVHSAGSHISLNGHAAVAERMIKAYDKFVFKQKVEQAVDTAKKVNSTLKKAVAITVGGAAVTFVTREVGGQIISAVIAAKIIKRAKQIFGENTDSTLLKTLRLVTIL